MKEGDYSSFSSKEQAALKFAERLTRDPHAVGDADIANLKPHFSESEIVDLDLLIGLLASETPRVAG